MSDKPLELTISASKIKTYLSCSMMYYLNYVERIPQKNNQGALLGGVVHVVLECLGAKNRRVEVDKIIKGATIKKSKLVKRYINYQCKKLKLSKESKEKIDKFIVIGLNADFWCKGGKIAGYEVKFDIASESPRYRAKGFIDILVEYDKFIRCRDWKSQKKVFTEEDMEESIQGSMYCLAALKMYPDKIPITDFCMLNFGGEQQRFPATKERIKNIKQYLAGFEYYLESIYTKLENFTYQDAWSNLAANKDPRPDHFEGKLICGFCRAKGEKKKDGFPKWHCAYRFGFDYYALYNGKNELLKTVMEKEELKPKSGERIEVKSFAGCPRFIKKNP